MANQTRVGLAFQGGGFPAGAIGAGVVKRLVEAGAFEKYDIGVFSGTSAGALVAAVCWGQQLKGEIEKAPDILRRQWLHFAYGLVPDARVAQMAQLADSLARMNPVYDFFAENTVVPALRHLMKEWVLTYIPVAAWVRLRDKKLAQAEPIPRLALGAADVLRGEVKVFNEKEFSLEAILASGSLDEVNGLTEIKVGSNQGVYCDGAWGTNPPINDMIDCDVDELWLVEVFPKERGQTPRTPAERKDRKDELWQNSLVEHELYTINKVNAWLKPDPLTGKVRLNNEDGKYRHITIKRMPMLLDLPAGAAFVNSPVFIEEMMAYGYKYAGLFLINSLTYDWQAGDGVAMDDFGYTVHISPGPQGEFIFYRHKGLNQAPTWIETFTPDEVVLARFYGLMVEKGLFTRKWKPRPGGAAGDSQERLTVTMLGKDYSIPDRLGAEEAALAREMYTAFESLVPVQIWAKFIAEHEKYEPTPCLLSL